MQTAIRGAGVAAAVAAGAVAIALTLSHQRKPRQDDTFLEEWNQLGDLEPVEGLEPHTTAGLPNSRLYPHVDLSKLAIERGWARPRALTSGKVILVKLEDDGDHHFAIEDADGNKLVCEIIPELPCANGVPKVGIEVYAWGIPRWDGQHKWGEIHPVIGWKEK